MVVVDTGQLSSCWLTVGKRGGFFTQKGACDTTPWHSKGLRERGGDCTENKPLSVRLVRSRLRTTHPCFGLPTPVSFSVQKGNSVTNIRPKIRSF